MAIDVVQTQGSPATVRKGRDLRRAVVVYNPVAGSRQGSAVAADAEARLQANGWEVGSVPTTARGGAAEIAREVAGDVELLVVAGGDGSLREAIDGLGERRDSTLVGVVPIGNANIVARELGIPLDPGAAIRLLGEGQALAVDLGWVCFNGESTGTPSRSKGEAELFLAVVGIGWDAETVMYLDRLRRSRWGRPWY